MEFKLKDIAHINQKTLKKDSFPNNFLYLDTKNLTSGKFGELVYFDTMKDKVPSRARRIVKENDILISTVRPNQRHYGFITKDQESYIVSTGFAVITPDETKVNPYFLYKYLTLENITNYLQSIAENSTSAYPAIKPSVLSELSIILPDKTIQGYISKLLRSLDDKMNLNEQIIANLEELSQTLYKRWFVDFEFPDENGNPYKSSGGEMIDSELGEIPLNWKCSKIKDINVIISDHVANGSFKSLKENVQFTEDLNDKYAVFARNVDLKKGDNRFEKYVTKSSYEFLRKSHLHGHEVIISNVGDVGSVYLSPILNRPMVLGNNQIFINSDEKSLNYYFYLFFKSSIGKNLIDSITSGSVQMKFNKTDLRNSLIVFPCKNDMNNLITVIKK
ncbi:hypothetical protein SSCS72_00042 [Mammaliicoccus sciuri]|uniref:restriction endonuclease subunit S n=1 Tax=Mammaliicoccus sciuri TaxID=1296 RepID=UPI001EF5B2B8|nr:restriction endonuclease subunit S [Mammaliicoccus sciuri]CAG7912299.1 hypothetical protein SSCS72_00042 [Mammaliicoccus sciuri]